MHLTQTQTTATQTDEPCAVIRLDIQQGDFPPDWTPHKDSANPTPELDYAPERLLFAYADAYNRDEFAQRKRRFAVVLLNGGILRVHVPAAAWPVEGLPPGATLFTSWTDALAHAANLNAPIRQTARVPRIWHVAIHARGATVGTTGA